MQHRTWSAIMHRAKRIGIKRNPIIQHEKTIFTSVKNPMYDLDTRKKSSCSLQGIHISKWNGFKSYEPYTCEFNQAFKNIIRLRDNFCCLNCGMSEQKHIIINGKRLHIHHIDYNKANTYLKNCCTLCNSCNSLANKNRNQWQEYYQNKLSSWYGYQYDEAKQIENVLHKN
jgi:hypothetical protein